MRRFIEKPENQSIIFNKGKKKTTGGMRSFLIFVIIYTFVRIYKIIINTSMYKYKQNYLLYKLLFSIYIKIK